MQTNLGETICKYRQIQNMTQEEFASRLGVTPQAVSKWERNTGFPDVSFLGGICSILGISADTLLGLPANLVEIGDITAEKEIRNNLIAEPLLLEFGKELIPCFIEGLETDYVNQKRKELAIQTGMLMPVIRIQDNADLEKNAYNILSYGKVLFSDTLSEINENTYSEIIEKVTSICRDSYAAILNKQIVKTMIDNLKARYPGIADDLVPEKISYLQIERKFQEILSGGGNLRNLIHILEEMEEQL